METITMGSLLMLKASEMITAPLGGELLMMDAELGKYFGLNEIGTLIWQRLQQPITPAALCAGLQAEFAVDSERCAADVLAFVRDLQRRGLLQIVGTAE